jgi:hypothetical protein
MREIRQSGSVRGVRSNPYPYRDFLAYFHARPLLLDRWGQQGRFLEV